MPPFFQPENMIDKMGHFYTEKKLIVRHVVFLVEISWPLQSPLSLPETNGYRLPDVFRGSDVSDIYIAQAHKRLTSSRWASYQIEDEVFYRELDLVISSSLNM